MKDKTVIITFASTITLLSFCLWAFILPNHLMCQESVQLFCFDSAYLWEMYAVPGGFASLISGFLIQFFLYPFAGAAIISALTLLMFLSVRKACGCSAVMALIPSVLMNTLLTSVNFTLAAPIAVLMCLWSWIYMKGRACGTAVHCILATALYFLAGPAVVLYPVMLILKGNARSGFAGLAAVVAAAALSALIYCHQQWWLFFTGPDYGHSRKQFSLWPMSLAFSIIVITMAGAVKCRRQWLITTLCCCLGFLAAWKLTDRNSLDLERIYAYDQAARNAKWDTILSLASKHTPDNIPSLVCYNLALAKTKRLGDMLFSVRQNGPEGLFPSYESGYLYMTTGSEALFQAGLVNPAMHYAFEANWAYPDMRQSVRQVRMLQMTNALSGHARVAEKYGLLLRKTLFYRHSLTPVAATPSNGPEALLLNDSDSFSKQAMLRELLDSHTGSPDETVDFLLSYDLLCKDLESFEKDFDRYWPEGKRVPESYQEALMMPFMTGRRSISEIDPIISQEVRDKASLFIKALKDRKGNAYILSHFGDTYWSYHARNI